MSRLHFRLTLIFSILIVFQISSVKAQPSLEEIESKMDEICASWTDETPGGVVGIVQDGELIFSKAFGLASLEYDVPNTTSTIFNIASVSKQFTAYSMVLLEQQEKLSIDDDVRKYLPEVPDFGTTITIRHLLTHTSGLRNFQNLLGIAGWRPGESMTNDDLLRFISRQRELNFPVGEEYLYCNSGFVLVTFIVERLTGQSFQDWTRENIFEPLGMTNTGYREDMEIIHKKSATSYSTQDDGTYRQPLKYWTYMGNGNVYTTAGDMAKWVNNFSSGTLGGMEGIQRLTEPGILNNGDTLTYGLGIGVSTHRGLDRYSHGGSVGGYRSNFAFYPEINTGFIVFSNFSSANPGGKNAQIIEFYLADQFKEPKEESKPRYPQLNEPVELDIAVFNEYTGEYFVEGVKLKVYEKEGNMMAQAIDYTPEMMLMAASDTSFYVPFANISLYMLRGKDDRPDRVVVVRGDDVMVGTKSNPELKAPDKLKSYTGTYYSPEVDTRFVLNIEDGKLIARHQRQKKVELVPLQKDFLLGDAFFLNRVKIERWQSGDIRGMKVSNGRVRDLWFEKID